MASLKTSVRSLEALFCCHATFLNCDSDIVVFVLRMVIPFCRAHPLLTPPPPLHPLPLLLSKHVIFRGLDIFVFNQVESTSWHSFVFSVFFVCAAASVHVSSSQSCKHTLLCVGQVLMQHRPTDQEAGGTGGAGPWPPQSGASCKSRSRPKFR